MRTADHPNLPRRGLTAAVLVLVLSLVGSACGSSSKPAGASSGGNPVDTTFTYGAFTPVMVGWDPSTDYSNEIIAMNNMYETLTRYDSQDGQVKPLARDLVDEVKRRQDVDVHDPPGREVPRR